MMSLARLTDDRAVARFCGPVKRDFVPVIRSVPEVTVKLAWNVRTGTGIPGRGGAPGWLSRSR